jgi:hypothetical protein
MGMGDMGRKNLGMGEGKGDMEGGGGYGGRGVTDLPCPSSNTEVDKSIAALKRCAWDFARHQTTHDHGYGHNGQVSYLESMDAYKFNMLAIGRMIAQ